MGYQPISGQGLGWDVPDFAGTLLKARQLEQQQEQARWAQLRDQGQQTMEAQRLAQAGQHEQNQQANHQAEVKRREDERVMGVNQAAFDIDKAGMPLQAEAYGKLHGVPYVAQHRQQQPVTGASPQPEQPQGQPAEQPVQQAMAGPEQPQQQAPTQPPEPEPTAIAGPVLDQKTAMDLEVQRTFGQENAPEQVYSAMLDRDIQEADLRRYNREYRQFHEAPPAQVEQPVAPQATPVQHEQQAQPQVPTTTTRMDPQIAGYSSAGLSEVQLEARRAEQEQNQYRAERYRAAFQGTDMQPYGNAAGALVAAGEDPKASDIVGMRNADATARARTERDDTYRLTAEEQKALRSEPLTNAEREKLVRMRNSVYGGGAAGTDAADASLYPGQDGGVRGHPLRVLRT